VIRIKTKCVGLTSITDTGWQWMHVDVQIVLVRCTGHAKSRRNPQLKQMVVIPFSLLVDINTDW
jgi:hypothetical protein